MNLPAKVISVKGEHSAQLQQKGQKFSLKDMTEDTTLNLRRRAVSMPELKLGTLHFDTAQSSLSRRSRASKSDGERKPEAAARQGLIDWIRLCRTKGKDMTEIGDVRISVIGPQMLSEHNTPEEDDCWTATIQGTSRSVS